MIPSNHKWFRNLAVSQIIVDRLESLDMKFPASVANLEEIRRKYHASLKEEKQN